MASITIVLKDGDTPKNQTVKHIHTYNSDVAPKVGEYVDIDGHPSYEVDRVIHKVSSKSGIIIVEVKEVERS